MRSSAPDEVSAELTRALGSIDGVRSVFPLSTVAAALLVISGHGDDSSHLVRVVDDGEAVQVSARIGTARTVPAAVVIAAATSAVAEVVAPRPFTLELELAAID